MDYNGGLFAQQEAQVVLGEIGAAELPEDAAYLVIRVSELSPIQRLRAWVESGNGELHSLRLSRAFDSSAISRLRDVMYRPGVGTWFSAVLRVDRSGSVDGEFNYDEEPEWAAPVDPIAYLTDFEKYPRDIENQPEWLRIKLTEGNERRNARS